MIGHDRVVTLLKELTAGLPPTIRLDWARKKQQMARVTLVNFGEWLGELADAASDEITTFQRIIHTD